MAFAQRVTPAEDRFTYATGNHEEKESYVIDHEPAGSGDFEKETSLLNGKKKAVWCDFCKKTES